MNAHEEKLVVSFFAKEKQGRYRFLLESVKPQRRQEFLHRLNHCYDFNERYVTWLPRDPRSPARDPEIEKMLREKGSPKMVYVLGSRGHAFNGQEVGLLEALAETSRTGWGTIISCIPGQLAYYFDESGERRAILERRLGS